MPKENRKRGKKHKNPRHQESLFEKYEAGIPEAADTTEGPSWIVSAPERTAETNADAPFGYVDPDVKAYFRTVDAQIKDWQDDDPSVDDNGDPNEEKRLFFVAALTEMTGKEKQLATDPDCSLMLERMIHSMDDFVRRVFADSLSGSYEILAKHRFSSHVCQTLLEVASHTISREARGVFPSLPDSSSGGELRAMNQLVLDICDELLPSFTGLIMDPFASHIIRVLVVLLCPGIVCSDSNSTQSTLRSKKSAAWKARQGSLKSTFTNQNEVVGTTLLEVPKSFDAMARKFIDVTRNKLSENEVRALAASNVSCPVLRILLELEAQKGMHEHPGSLMDKVTVGLVSNCRDDLDATREPSDYLNTLLRDPTSSHLLERILALSPNAVFDSMWKTYFKGKLVRLAGHPVANFVLAHALERVSESQLGEALGELAEAWSKSVKTHRTGVLRAAVDRSAALSNHEAKVVQAVYIAFELGSDEKRDLLVPCILRLKSLKEHETLLESGAEQKTSESLSKSVHKKHGTKEDPTEPTTQGAVLLQSLLLLAAPHCEAIVNRALEMSEIIKLACHPTSSRVLDALIESPTVPFKTKRQFVSSFVGYFHTLVDDRIGSRVADRFWAFADLSIKEKIARSLVPHEMFLAGSFYGKFFARNLNLHLLQKRPADWKRVQSERSSKTAPGQSRKSQVKKVEGSSSTSHQLQNTQDVEGGESGRACGESRKKKLKRADDEIDVVFGSKVKDHQRAALSAAIVAPTAIKSAAVGEEDKSLRDVLGAIQAAPREDKKHRIKRKRET